MGPASTQELVAAIIGAVCRCWSEISRLALLCEGRGADYVAKLECLSGDVGFGGDDAGCCD